MPDYSILYYCIFPSFNPPENYSVPSKKPASAASDPKSKSVGAKKTTTRPASGARAVSKPAPVSNGKFSFSKVSGFKD